MVNLGGVGKSKITKGFTESMNAPRATTRQRPLSLLLPCWKWVLAPQSRYSNDVNDKRHYQKLSHLLVNLPVIL